MPVLWDKEKKTIVNNESSEILRMFNSEFNHLAKHPELDLYPVRQSDELVSSGLFSRPCPQVPVSGL